MIKANLDPSIEIEERNKSFYHVLVVKRIFLDSDQMKFDDIPKVCIFDGRGWMDFQNNLNTLGFIDAQLIHDPELNEPEPIKEPVINQDAAIALIEENKRLKNLLKLTVPVKKRREKTIKTTE